MSRSTLANGLPVAAQLQCGLIVIIIHFKMDFLTSLRRFIYKHDLLPHGSTGAPSAPVIVGVSGGADSLGLLYALNALAPELDLHLHVAHLDHQLRGAEARADADFVRDSAQRLGLPHTIESRDVKGFARNHKLSLEEAARQVRYSFLLEVALAQHSDTIAVAHNADDQAESVLMHFLRGSGLSGLRGMLPKMLMGDLRLLIQQSAFSNQQHLRRTEPPAAQGQVSKIYLVRPFLETPRATIDDYCAQHDLHPRTDSTNADTTYFRNRLRHELLPLLETYNPQIRSILRRTANVIAAEHEVLQAHTNYAWGMTVVEETNTAVTFDLPLWREHPIGVRRALLRQAIQQLRPPLRDIDFGHVENAIEILQRASTGDQVTLPQHLFMEVSYDTFTIAPRDELTLPDWPLLPDRSASLIVNVPGITPLPESPWIIEVTFEPCDHSHVPLSRLAACFDADTLPGLLTLRRRTSADRFHPQGMPSSVRLKDWMINVKIPRLIRDRLPLLVAGDQIVWVPGYRVGQPYLVRSETRRIIKLVFRKA
jgi:tRNA(Ile)-lysidine synthetase-like protein